MKRILLKFLSKHILVMKFGQFMLYYKRKIFINFFWKLWPENEFQALLKGIWEVAHPYFDKFW